VWTSSLSSRMLPSLVSCVADDVPHPANLASGKAATGASSNTYFCNKSGSVDYTRKMYGHISPPPTGSHSVAENAQARLHYTPPTVHLNMGDAVRTGGDTQSQGLLEIANAIHDAEPVSGEEVYSYFYRYVIEHKTASGDPIAIKLTAPDRQNPKGTQPY
jgi:hypothetical protein